MGIYVWTDNAISDSYAKLVEVRDRLRKLPTAKRTVERLTAVCNEIESIAQDFAAADHNGNG